MSYLNQGEKLNSELDVYLENRYHKIGKDIRNCINILLVSKNRILILFLVLFILFFLYLKKSVPHYVREKINYMHNYTFLNYKVSNSKVFYYSFLYSFLSLVVILIVGYRIKSVKKYLFESD